MRTTLAVNRAEVWGSPINHSKSPLLHNAAYGVLGIDALYERRDVSEGDLESALDLVDESWLGVSLTMPLKERILDLVENASSLVSELESANTVSWLNGALTLDNTDVWGALQAVRHHGIQNVHSAVVLGAGATARSVIRALHELGCENLALASRDEARSRATIDYASSRGIRVHWVSLECVADIDQASLVASTLPGGASPPRLHPSLVASATLFDVAYEPWPSALASTWSDSSHGVISGLSMLVFQALAQIRIFHHHNAELPLPDEERVLDAMWRAVGVSSA